MTDLSGSYSGRRVALGRCDRLNGFVRLAAGRVKSA